MVSIKSLKVMQLNIEDFVHDYYYVERFKMAYQFQITPMNDKSEWPTVNLGFEIIPPPLQRVVGRPRKQRVKAKRRARKKRTIPIQKVFSVWTYRE